MAAHIDHEDLPFLFVFGDDVKIEGMRGDIIDIHPAGQVMCGLCGIAFGAPVKETSQQPDGKRFPPNRRRL